MNDHDISMALLFFAAAIASFGINNLIRTIQDERKKPKRAPINTEVFKTYKHREKDRDENNDSEE